VVKQFFIESIASCKCDDITSSKFAILQKAKQSVYSEIDRCLLMYKRGFSQKDVYASIPEKFISHWRGIISKCALREYKKGKEPGSSRTWIYESIIEEFELKPSYDKKFQATFKFKLPFEIQNKQSVILKTTLPKNFFKDGKDKIVYRQGFDLIVKQNSVHIRLIHKKEVKENLGCMVKAIYASPYGGLHTCTMLDLEKVKEHEELKEYYQGVYGCSRESNSMLKLLERLRGFEHQDTYHKDIEHLKVKCKTRANHLFKNMKKHVAKIVFVSVDNNDSKVTDVIQETYKKQIQKLCLKYDKEFVEVRLSQEELHKKSLYCMRKVEREEYILNNRPVKSRFKAAAGLSMHYPYVRIGIRKMYRTQNERCSETVSMAPMREAVLQPYYEDDEDWL
jgi:hypothetical protein